MLNDITIGQFFPGQSVVHRLDPRSKIVFCVVFIAALFVANSAATYVLAAFVFVLAAILSQVPLRMVAKSVKPLWLIVLLTIVFQAFSGDGLVLMKFGKLTVTQTGLETGAMMSLRLVLLIVMSSLLTLTTSPLDLTDAIERLLNPFKKIGVPAHEIAMMMTIALRFIPTLIEEMDRIMKAQQSRGAEFTEGNLLNRARGIVPLIVPLFVSAFRRADELAMAMEARCYRGGEGRTRMKVLSFRPEDGVTVLFGFGYLLVTIGMRYYFKL
ncbi:MAG: energy-coupling factor transporter transmembrane component T [Negativicutes bacterium]